MAAGDPGRYKLTIEYDGSRYSGWQKQKDAVTLQGTLTQAAAEVLRQPVDVQGNGRTDAGVHGLRYVAHLAAAGGYPVQTLQEQLNAVLPHDMVVLAVEAVDPRFHARHHCLARSYIYQIAKRKTAFCKRFVWWIPESLDLERMHAAAAMLAGMHDFASYADRQAIKNKSSKVMVNKTQLVETEDLVLFRIVGSHFLWKMVRRLVVVLVEVGRTAMDPAEFAALLQEPEAGKVRLTAPPQGLFFERAFYDEAELKAFLASDRIQPNFF